MIREILGNKIKLIYKPRSRPELRELHYRTTPYAYLPQEARKLVRSHYIDLGQGLLGAIDDVRRGLGRTNTKTLPFKLSETKKKPEPPPPPKPELYKSKPVPSNLNKKTL